MFEAIGAFVFIIIGAIFVLISIFIIIKSRRTHYWPQAIGTVIFTEVRKKVSRSHKSASTTYHPYIQYEYSVGGMTYQCDEYSPSLTRSALEPLEVEIILKDYPIGHQLPVFYNPQKPEKAVLLPGDSIGNWLFLGIGSIILIVGLFLAHKSW